MESLYPGTIRAPRSLPRSGGLLGVELETMFREHRRGVYAYFVRVVGNRHDAEELTQETSYRACTAALRFRGDASARTWLFGIARRVLLEASRKGLFERPAEVSPGLAADE